MADYASYFCESGYGIIGQVNTVSSSFRSKSGSA
jgi:hypothetical protein